MSTCQRTYYKHRLVRIQQIHVRNEGQCPELVRYRLYDKLNFTRILIQLHSIVALLLFSNKSWKNEVRTSVNPFVDMRPGKFIGKMAN